ncbi:MAG: ATP-dependent Zn protease, partial [Betaproteobacteria bacterium]
LGLSPAAIAATVNQAAVRAARAGDAQVFMQHMADAIETAHLGELNGTLLTPAELYRTAIHEAGHALASVLRQSGKVEKVTVLPRGSALGVTFISQEEAMKMHTENTLKHRIDVMLAGRCAEEILFGDVSNGAASDLHHATDIATGMIARFGFGSGLAVLSREQLSSAAFLEQLNGLLGTRYAETRALLTEYRASLEAIAERLLKEETIEGSVVRELAGVA